MGSVGAGIGGGVAFCESGKEFAKIQERADNILFATKQQRLAQSEDFQRRLSKLKYALSK